MELNNQLSQVQKNIITQKMIEQLQILQMPGFELSQHIEEMVNSNPLLESDMPMYDANTEGMDEKYSRQHSGEKQSNVWQEAHDGDEFLSFVKAEVTLPDYLKHQLLELKLHPRDTLIVRYLIESLDQDGYLKEDSEELAKLLRLPVERIERGIRILRKLEPAGVGARNLKECLLLQLKRKKLLDSKTFKIVSDCFELLASSNFAKISKETGVSRDETERICSVVKSLNPKPGCSFLNREPQQYIVPDLFLIELNGKYTVEFNKEAIPEVRINNYYANLLNNPDTSPAVREYIKKQLSGAHALISVLEQRKKTITDVANFIVTLQQDFFKGAADGLKPLTMQNIADSLGIHVSTVSRAVNGKYIETPKGVFELRYFFASKIESESESSTSATSVKNLIRKIIQEEDKRKPLSDEHIRAKLESLGIKAARRTIAKYRDELSILPASMRKK